MLSRKAIRLIKIVVRQMQILRIAFWGYKLSRLIRKPHTYGALIAIWENNELLLVKTSYRRGYCLPGGMIKPGEGAHNAAVREIKEELGVTISSKSLKDKWCLTEKVKGGFNTVTIFTLPWESEQNLKRQKTLRPKLKIDNFEIIGTTWMTKKEALKHELPNHLRNYLKNNFEEE